MTTGNVTNNLLVDVVLGSLEDLEEAFDTPSYIELSQRQLIIHG